MNCNSSSVDVGECPVTKYKKWIDVPGTTDSSVIVPEFYYWTNPVFCYTEACTGTSPTTIKGVAPLLYVKETIYGAAGYKGHVVYGKITGDFESENGFLTHVWWSDYEASDPINNGHTTAACTWNWNNTYEGPNVPLPKLTGISPTSGSTAGGTPVTLTGSGFVNGATVTFGGYPATTVVFVSKTELTVRTPAHAKGTVAVLVTTVNGVSTSVEFRYKFAGPTLTKITPSAGKTAGGTTVTLTGTGFLADSTVNSEQWQARQSKS